MGVNPPPPPPVKTAFKKPSLILLGLIRVLSLSLQFDIFENSAKRIYSIFVKSSIADVWQDCEYTWDPEYNKFLNMALVLKMPGFYIYQGSEHTKILNIPDFEYAKVLYMSDVLIYQKIYQGSEYVKGSEYARILNVPVFWIFQSSKFVKISKYTRVLNRAG